MKEDIFLHHTDVMTNQDLQQEIIGLAIFNLANDEKVS